MIELAPKIANAKVGPWLQRIARQRCHGATKEKPVDRLAKEIKYLERLPALICLFNTQEARLLNIGIAPLLESLSLQHTIEINGSLLAVQHVTA